MTTNKVKTKLKHLTNCEKSIIINKNPKDI